MKMILPSNKTLLKYAVYVGFGSISAIMWMRYKIEERIRSSEYFRLAMKDLRQHKGAIKLLGEPIKDTGFDLTDSTKNFCDGQNAQFEVKVKGSKNKGTMYFWSTHTMDKGWLLNRLELELNNEPGKRFLLKKGTPSQ